MRSKKKDAADELAEKMLAVLEAQRGLGGESYPLTLRRLGALADPQAPAKLVEKAVGKEPFKDRAVVLGKKNQAGPVALRGDEETLAASPLLLEFLVGLACTPKKPTVAVAALMKKVGADLQDAFAAALETRIRENTLPTGVECLTVGKVKHLHPRNLPLPEVILAEKLLRVLEAQRQLGGDSYPLPRKRLVELADPTAKEKLVKNALSQPAVRSGVLLIDAKKPEAPLALAEDREQLGSSRLLLEYLLKSKRKPSQQTAFPVGTLLPKKSDLYHSFNESIRRGIKSDSLPPTVGWLWASKKPLLFLLQDVHPARRAESRPPPPPAPAPAVPPPADFARTFDDAFQWINRQHGAHNFVSLVELRRALPLARDVFDGELRKLRVAGRYTLSGAEGRHGLTPEDREAGITEDGSLLLYVSRKTP